MVIVGNYDRLHHSFCEESDIEYKVVKMSRKISLWSDCLSLISMIRVLSAFSPDIVHTHTPKASLVGMIAARLLSVKHRIFHCHGFVFIKFNKVTSRIGFFIERLPILFANNVLCVSRSLSNFLVDNGYSFNREINVIHNGSIMGVDLKLFDPDKYKNNNFTSLSCNSNKEGSNFIVGYLGRVAIDKGIETFINILKELYSKNKNIIGRIAGSVEIPNLESLLDESVEYVGCLERKDIPEFLSECNILLFPSCREGFGMAALEASAMGVPVVGYNIIGLCDAIKNGETGILVDSESEKLLLEAILHLYESKFDREKLGSFGRKYAEEQFKSFDVENAFLCYYEKLIQ